MKKDLKFLKELQLQLNTQDRGGQATPTFWTIGDFHFVDCQEGDHEAYDIHVPNESYYGDFHEYVDSIAYRLDEHELSLVGDLEDSEDIWGWMRTYIHDDIHVVPVKEEHFIQPNTLFITKKEAEEHLEAKRHNYSEKAHTFSMTALDAPVLTKLYQVLSEFDWDNI